MRLEPASDRRRYSWRDHRSKWQFARNRRKLRRFPSATPPHRPFHLAPGLALADRLALVVDVLAARQRDLDLRMRPLEVHARRHDGQPALAKGVAEADARARALAVEDRPLLVELPPVAAQLAHREHALVGAVAEDDERAGADERDDLAVVDGLVAALEDLALEQERRGDVV